MLDESMIVAFLVLIISISLAVLGTIVFHRPIIIDFFIVVTVIFVISVAMYNANM